MSEITIADLDHKMQKIITVVIISVITLEGQILKCPQFYIEVQYTFYLKQRDLTKKYHHLGNDLVVFAATRLSVQTCFLKVQISLIAYLNLFLLFRSSRLLPRLE